jgi:hypothetical protein
VASKWAWWRVLRRVTRRDVSGRLCPTGSEALVRRVDMVRRRGYASRVEWKRVMRDEMNED